MISSARTSRHPAEQGAADDVFGVGAQQPEGAEHAGRGRHDDARHAQRPRNLGRDDRAVAAERHQHEIARVAAAIGRHRLDGAGHVGGGYDVGAPRSIGDADAERLCDLVAIARCGEVGVQRSPVRRRVARGLT